MIQKGYCKANLEYRHLRFIVNDMLYADLKEPALTDNQRNFLFVIEIFFYKMTSMLKKNTQNL